MAKNRMYKAADNKTLGNQQMVATTAQLSTNRLNIKNIAVIQTNL